MIAWTSIAEELSGRLTPECSANGAVFTSCVQLCICRAFSWDVELPSQLSLFPHTNAYMPPHHFLLDWRTVYSGDRNYEQQNLQHVDRR
jgi:hypothetical protein